MAEGSRDVLCCDGDGSGFERFLSWEQIISKHIALSGIFSPLDLLPAPKSKNKTKLKRTLGVGVLAVSTKKPGKILLVTARHSKSWALVKGHIDRSLGALESARREAFEEAGVRGRISPVPIGSYIHKKSADAFFRVRVFRMRVSTELSKWPEKKERQRRWVPVRSALKMIQSKAFDRPGRLTRTCGMEVSSRERGGLLRYDAPHLLQSPGRPGVRRGRGCRRRRERPAK
jgi:8-oxo-dGTP pyrophosphatase MutT (NUDIX family)